jgi:FKBP-type peptidyl-prolyl cis-trans isomerase
MITNNKMNMKIKFLCLFLMGITLSFSQTKAKKTVTKKAVVKEVVAKADVSKNTTDGIFAEFQTSKGKIVVQLEYKNTPVTVANFISLAEGNNPQVSADLKGKPFFNGLKFHRVISKLNGDQQDFMIQGGDPKGDGSGGPGYAFKDEFTDAKFDKPGILAMANSGPKTNGSQFFITLVPTPWLNGKHTIYGYVTTGQDVVGNILKNDVINTVTIKRVGNEAKAFDAVKVFNDYFAGKAVEEKIEVEKMAAAKEAALKEFTTAQTTASGLKYLVIKEGTGEKPVATSNVKVHYTGMLLDGKIFDSSVQRGEPIDFGLNQVIPGWTEGVQLMKEGAKYKFYIPSNLAYGSRGAGGVIPPNADLIFEVELLKINK